MELSIPQIALMSRLLDEALPLDAARRREWLERLPPEYHELAPALREALLPGELETGSLNALTSLPKFGAAEGGDFTSASGLKPGARGTRGPVRADSTAGRRGHGGSLAGPTPRWRLQARGGAELPMLAHARAGLEARFARERDILASLEHPSDAQGNAAFTATLLSFEELGLSASKRPDDKGR
jgi:eukaryotic-like serine/threonine-protein kinase